MFPLVLSFKNKFSPNIITSFIPYSSQTYSQKQYDNRAADKPLIILPIQQQITLVHNYKLSLHNYMAKLVECLHHNCFVVNSNTTLSNAALIAIIKLRHYLHTI